ncbi:MAG: OmpA family protein [Pseudomonadota bacterium]
MERRLLLSALAAAALTAGCATSTQAPPVQQAPGTAPSAPPVTVLSLPDEQRRLAELFRGTPVVFEMTSEGSMRVEVPLKFSFDKGRAVVKPPLAKVLDYLAPSARAPGMRARVAAPGDGRNAGQLARERAASARDYLVGKGVPAAHFAAVNGAPAEAIEILIGKL